MDSGFFHQNDFSSNSGKSVSTNSHRMSSNKGVIIVSVVENRAREVCICKTESANLSVLELHIMYDSHSYTETLLSLQAIDPDEVDIELILLHDGTHERVLTRKIIELFPSKSSNRIVFISRQYFDQDRGSELLRKVTAGDVDADLISKYTVLAGSYCLLRYIENCNGSVFAPHSIRLEYGSGVISGARMAIDRKTAASLELINNAKSGNQKDSLFGVINYTKTVVGARLLRATILRPLTDIPTIELRLDAIEELLNNNRMFNNVVEVLSRLPDLDKMLHGLCTVPKTVTLKTAKVGIDSLIFIKHSLKITSQLATTISEYTQTNSSTETTEDNTVLGMSQQPLHTHKNNNSNYITNTLLLTILSILKDASFESILTKIDNALTESTSYSKVSLEMRHQECFAVRPGVHGLLDVARKSFLQSVEDIYALAEKYSLDYNISVKIAYNASRGYYIVLPTEIEGGLPAIFVQAVLNKKSISCTTEELSSLADRANEAITYALKLTNELIQNLLQEIREQMDALFALTDSIALLDLLCSATDLVALSPMTFTRPCLKADGPLVVKSGRHPIMSIVQRTHFISNDCFLAPAPLHNLLIITGPNGSGKSTFLKQIGLVVILAQIGCFVPAAHATVPVRDRILSRMGTSDDMENNMSTFHVEMKDTAYIINNLTSKSLVLVDELGRGTSNIDGISIAVAVAEALMQSTSCLSLYVTHYSQITTLAGLYPTMKNIHLKTTMNAAAIATNDSLNINSNSNSGIHFLHEIGSGPCEVDSGYGISMAEQCGFPSELVRDARQIQTTLRRAFPLLLAADGVDRSMTSLNSLLQQLLLLKDSTLDNNGLKSYLNALHKKIPNKTSRDRMLSLLHKLDDTNDSSSTKISNSKVGITVASRLDTHTNSGIKATVTKAVPETAVATSSAAAINNVYSSSSTAESIHAIKPQIHNKKQISVTVQRHPPTITTTTTLKTIESINRTKTTANRTESVHTDNINIINKSYYENNNNKVTGSNLLWETPPKTNPCTVPLPNTSNTTLPNHSHKLSASSTASQLHAATRLDADDNILTAIKLDYSEEIEEDEYYNTDSQYNIHNSNRVQNEIKSASTSLQSSEIVVDASREDSKQRGATRKQGLDNSYSKKETTTKTPNITPGQSSNVITYSNSTDDSFSLTSNTNYSNRSDQSFTHSEAISAPPSKRTDPPPPTVTIIPSPPQTSSYHISSSREGGGNKRKLSDRQVDDTSSSSRGDTNKGEKEKCDDDSNDDDDNDDNKDEEEEEEEGVDFIEHVSKSSRSSSGGGSGGVGVRNVDREAAVVRTTQGGVVINRSID